MFYCFNFSAYIRFFIKGLIDTNVNISNELNFSDVYRSVNYIGSLGVYSLCTRPNAVYTSINLINLKNKNEFFLYQIPAMTRNDGSWNILQIWRSVIGH